MLPEVRVHGGDILRAQLRVVGVQKVNVRHTLGQFRGGVIHGIGFILDFHGSRKFFLWFEILLPAIFVGLLTPRVDFLSTATTFPGLGTLLFTISPKADLVRPSPMPNVPGILLIRTWALEIVAFSVILVAILSFEVFRCNCYCFVIVL